MEASVRSALGRCWPPAAPAATCFRRSRWPRSSAAATSPVDLVTDMRGDRYGSNFPARAVYRVPSATLAGRSPTAGGPDRLDARARHRRLLRFAAGIVKPGAVVGFGGYPAFPPLVAARLRRHPDRPARAERGARARQPRARQARHRHRHLVRGHQVPRRRAPSPRCALTGNPVRDQVVDWATQSYQPPHARTGPSRCWCSAAARARASSPMHCRRRLRCCRRRSAPACSSCSSAARRT